MFMVVQQTAQPNRENGAAFVVFFSLRCRVKL